MSEALEYVQRHVKKTRVRLKDFCKMYDKNNRRVLSKSLFQRALDMAGLPLGSKQIDELTSYFEDGPGIINYNAFCTAVEEVFTINNLESRPTFEVKTALDNIKMHEYGQKVKLVVEFSFFLTNE